MYKSLRESLRVWNATNGERNKLQHAYIATAIIMILVAGVLGLFNYNLGQQLTAIAMLAFGMFFVNLIAWTLLSGIVLASLENIPEPTSTTPVATKKTSANTKANAKTKASKSSTVKTTAKK